MTTQLQPPVTVTPPLPTRRNAELLLLCFAAVITMLRYSSWKPIKTGPSIGT